MSEHVIDHTCDGEDRVFPDSWDDPDIADAWAAPEHVEPTTVPDGLVP